MAIALRDGIEPQPNLQGANRSYSISKRANELMAVASRIRDQALAASTLAYFSPEAAEQTLKEAVEQARDLGLNADNEGVADLLARVRDLFLSRDRLNPIISEIDDVLGDVGEED